MYGDQETFTDTYHGLLPEEPTAGANKTARAHKARKMRHDGARAAQAALLAMKADERRAAPRIVPSRA